MFFPGFRGKKKQPPRQAAQWLQSAAASALLLGLLTGFASAAKEEQSVYAVASGGWDEDIWGASDGLKSPLQPGLRPGENDDVVLVGRPSGGIQLSLRDGEKKVVRFGSYARPQFPNALEIGGGGVLVCTQGFVGASAGELTVNLAEGGKLEVRGTHFVLTKLEGSKGLFVQDEGSVVEVGPEGMTRLTGAKESEGNYQLNGGRFNTGRYFISGPGLAQFDWTGGTLEILNSTVEIENKGRGILSPGGNDTAETFEIKAQGSYSQGPEAVTRIEIAGEKEYDRILDNGRGKIQMAGTIEVHLLNGFKPRAGQKFEVVSSPGLEAGELRLAGPAASAFDLVVEDDRIVLKAR